MEERLVVRREAERHQPGPWFDRAGADAEQAAAEPCWKIATVTPSAAPVESNGMIAAWNRTASANVTR
jgi:hypothetical protein